MKCDRINPSTRPFKYAEALILELSSGKYDKYNEALKSVSIEDIKDVYNKNYDMELARTNGLAFFHKNKTTPVKIERSYRPIIGYIHKSFFGDKAFNYDRRKDDEVLSISDNFEYDDDVKKCFGTFYITFKRNEFTDKPRYIDVEFKSKFAKDIIDGVKTIKDLTSKDIKTYTFCYGTLDSTGKYAYAEDGYNDTTRHNTHSYARIDGGADNGSRREYYIDGQYIKDKVEFDNHPRVLESKLESMSL